MPKQSAEPGDSLKVLACALRTAMISLFLWFTGFCGFKEHNDIIMSSSTSGSLWKTIVWKDCESLSVLNLLNKIIN